MTKYIILLSIFIGAHTYALPDKIVFVKRNTYTSNHYYTQYLNSKWLPGGGLFSLDLKTKKEINLVPEFKNGVFQRFDIDYDARHIMFAYKPSAMEGYRLYEIEINPNTGARVGHIRQVTKPTANEANLVNLYRDKVYHHGTDDLSPCYLPDGGIVFVSTRCQYGILCNNPDSFTTTVLYRMDRDGSKMQQLSRSALSEATPAILEDGRILYTRWEYVDKGAVSVKCLWAVNPDGTGSVEVYGSNVNYPPTLLGGRQIPGTPGQYIVSGTPHYPNNSVGTIIKIDSSKNVRTREPMTYLTPEVDIRSQGGFHFPKDGKWIRDKSGKAGPLYKDPYPLSKSVILASYKPKGLEWNDAKGYGLVVLDNGVKPLYRDPAISCFLPYPLKPRKRPPVITTRCDATLAQKNEAICVVTNVYHGMDGVKRGEAKYIRVLEQIPRPWAARRFWKGDEYDQQHAAITKDTHLGLKVQHGVVPIESDGSAYFVVPADKDIFFQVLDKNYMSIQSERTFVNYRPGETRSCIGCHETPNDAVPTRANRKLMALQRQPSRPGPQPGETTGQRPLDFVLDVQPVLDRHCIECHGGDKPKAKLDLRGTPTVFFSVSYENLIEARLAEKKAKKIGVKVFRGRPSDKLLIGRTIGENHPKTGNVAYLPPKSLGSHCSVLVAMLAPDKVKLADPKDAARAAALHKKHSKIKLKPEELLKITNWIDTNAQYYGMYWGRKNLRYKDHPNFRPKSTFERATSMTSLIPEDKR